MTVVFKNDNGFPAPPMNSWDPIVIKRAEIAAHIEALADGPSPEHGIRAVRLVHPQAPNPGQGLAPTIACTIQVLRPGERTTPMRHNASEVSICLQGRATAQIGSRRIELKRFSFWNTPAMHPFTYVNDGDELFVRLSYSNAALLEMLAVHYVEHLSGADQSAKRDSAAVDAVKPKAVLPPPIPIGDGEAQLLTYEHLIAPEVIENAALHWPWEDIIANRDRLFSGDALKNKGRRGLFMLYNPATTRLLGATHTLFATVGFMPADTLDFPHRHSSSAINYCIAGDQVSEVDGRRLIWEEGDIAYTAPGWSAHANGTRGGGTAFTCQDHPFQMATEALIWQEGEGKPIRLLGAETGFVSDDSIQLRGAA